MAQSPDLLAKPLHKDRCTSRAETNTSMKRWQMETTAKRIIGSATSWVSLPNVPPMHEEAIVDPSLVFSQDKTTTSPPCCRNAISAKSVITLDRIFSLEHINPAIFILRLPQISGTRTKSCLTIINNNLRI